MDIPTARHCRTNGNDVRPEPGPHADSVIADAEARVDTTRRALDLARIDHEVARLRLRLVRGDRA
jgi:hypothetical protein